MFNSLPTTSYRRVHFRPTCKRSERVKLKMNCCNVASFQNYGRINQQKKKEVTSEVEFEFGSIENVCSVQYFGRRHTFSIQKSANFLSDIDLCMIPFSKSCD